MPELPVASNSQWDKSTIETYLQQSVLPMRVACHDAGDFPMICSLWFFYENGVLWAASHENSKLVNRLRSNNKIAFEIASNEQPYCGVRGKATVSLAKGNAEVVLQRLIGRFLTENNESLAKWLLSRSQHELALRLEINSINSWDYSSRMNRA